jgi:hypothetical protein
MVRCIECGRHIRTGRKYCYIHRSLGREIKYSKKDISPATILLILILSMILFSWYLWFSYDFKSLFVKIIICILLIGGTLFLLFLLKAIIINEWFSYKIKVTCPNCSHINTTRYRFGVVAQGNTIRCSHCKINYEHL